MKQKYPSSGIFEHCKSTVQNRRYYQVIGTARHTETDEKLVVYVPLYVIPEHKGLSLQVRPLSMFLGTVEWQGNIVPRFKFIGNELS